VRPPTYNNSYNITDRESLAASLAISLPDLIEIATNRNRYYASPKEPIRKADKTIRKVFCVRKPLKQIQANIKKKIFYDVHYPPYLLGSLPNIDLRRDYIKNAELHAGSYFSVSEDINNFFSSIKAKFVFRLWRELFGFKEDIAILLTKLTTYRDSVPQGAATSSFIGNLIFYDREHLLVDEMHSRGFIYTRFVDDIQISSKHSVNREDVSWITSSIYGMLASKQLQPCRRKRKIQTAARQMTVHNLRVNSGRPTLGRSQISKIRAAVHKLELLARNSRNTLEYQKVYRSVFGQVENLIRIQPQKGQKLKKHLVGIRPLLDNRRKQKPGSQ
jgi:hypothetical protein